MSRALRVEQLFAEVRSSFQPSPSNGTHESFTQFDIPSPQTATTPGPQCACLSTMYLSLAALQSVGDSYTTSTIYTLREALSNAWNVLECTSCWRQFLPALHNVQLLGAMVLTLSERYHCILDRIEAEEARASAAGQSLPIQIADLHGATTHVHTSQLKDRPDSFEISMVPAEWRKITKKIIKGEVESSLLCCPSLISLIKHIDYCQTQWHNNPLPADFPKHLLKDAKLDPEVLGRDHTCMNLVLEAKAMIARLNYD